MAIDEMFDSFERRIGEYLINLSIEFGKINGTRRRNLVTAEEVKSDSNRIILVSC